MTEFGNDAVGDGAALLSAHPAGGDLTKQLVASTVAPAQDSTANVMMTVADALHRHIAGYTHLYILILKRLHIESNGGYGLDRLV